MHLQPILIFAFIPVYLLVVYLFHKYREWLLYYLFGAFGFTLIVTYFLSYFRIDEFLVAIEVFHTNIIANFFNIPSQALAYGRLQLPMQNGWSILSIGIECSAVLEMSALSALLAFYPAFSGGRKIIKIVFGLIVTYIINTFRMLIIMAMTYHLGINYVFVAHAVVGRLFFFVCIIALYWFLITKPTIGSVGRFLEKGLKVTRTTILKEPRRAVFVSNIFMILIPIGAISLAAVSFAQRDDWKTAFERRIVPPEREIAVEVPKEKVEIEIPELKETVGHGKVMNLTPEVLGERKEGIDLIPAITILKTDNQWLCQIRNPKEHAGKEFYYLWLNTEDGQEIIIGPTKEFKAEIKGFEDENWQCFVAENQEEFNKLGETE